MTRLPVLVFLRNISLYTGRNLIYICVIYMCVHSVFLYQIVQGLFFLTAIVPYQPRILAC